MNAVDVLFEFKGFKIYWIFGNLNPEVATKLVAFWLENGAISHPEEALRRTAEVGCLILNQQNEIVGVNSIYMDSLMPSGSSYWFYRTFIRPDSRVSGLNSKIFNATFKQLSLLRNDASNSPRGLVVVAENAKFQLRAAIRALQRVGLERLGTDHRGVSVWRRSFDL